MPKSGEVRKTKSRILTSFFLANSNTVCGSAIIVSPGQPLIENLKGKCGSLGSTGPASHADMLMFEKFQNEPLGSAIRCESECRGVESRAEIQCFYDDNKSVL